MVKEEGVGKKKSITPPAASTEAIVGFLKQLLSENPAGFGYILDLVQAGEDTRKHGFSFKGLQVPC